MYLPNRDERKNCLQQISNLYGGKLIDRSFGDELHFNLKKHDYIIRYDNDGPDDFNQYALYRGGIYYTDLIYQHSRFPYHFNIKSQSLFEKLFNFFIFNKIKLGNEEFDKNFYIDSNNRDDIISYLKYQKAQILYKIFLYNRNHIIFEQRADCLRLRLQGWKFDPTRLKELFEYFLELIH